MIYGIPLIRRVSDRIDRVGIRTLVLAQEWQPSRSDLTQAEIDAEKPTPPAAAPGMILIGSQTQPFGGVYSTLWTYEGIEGDGRQVTFQDREHTLDYGFKPGLAQVSIKLFKGLTGNDPKAFQGLLDQFGGILDIDSDQIIWPPTMPEVKKGSGAVKGASSGGDFNPMFGIQDFFRMEGTYTCRYASFKQVVDVGAGLVTYDIPGKPETPKDGRNYMKVPTSWQRRGFIYENMETFWLSGPGGWPEPVYGRGR